MILFVDWWEKVMFTLQQAKVLKGEQMYRSTLSLTSALERGGWLTPCLPLFIV